MTEADRPTGRAEAIAALGEIARMPPPRTVGGTVPREWLDEFVRRQFCGHDDLDSCSKAELLKHAITAAGGQWASHFVSPHGSTLTGDALSYLVELLSADDADTAQRAGHPLLSTRPSLAVHLISETHPGLIVGGSWARFFVRVGYEARMRTDTPQTLVLSMPCDVRLPLALMALGAVHADLRIPIKGAAQEYFDFLKQLEIGTTILWRQPGRRRAKKLVIAERTGRGHVEDSLFLKAVGNTRTTASRLPRSRSVGVTLVASPDAWQYQPADPHLIPPCFRESRYEYGHAALFETDTPPTDLHLSASRTGLVSTDDRFRDALGNVDVVAASQAPLRSALALDRPWGRDPDTPFRLTMRSPEDAQEGAFTSVPSLLLVADAVPALKIDVGSATVVVAHSRRSSEREAEALAQLHRTSTRYCSDQDREWCDAIVQAAGPPPPGLMVFSSLLQHQR